MGSNLKHIDDIAQEDFDKIVNRVWFNLMRAHRNLHPQIEKTLKQHGFDSPVWHEILIEIEISGKVGLRTSELQQKLNVTQYNLSRHLTRIAAKDLITRAPDPTDRRNQILFITEKGQRLNAQIWPAYHQAIQDTIAERFTKDEAYQLFLGLIKLYP